MFEKGFCIKHGHGKIKLGTACMVYGATGQRKAVKPWVPQRRPKPGL
jgi:hypothetical protein